MINILAKQFPNAIQTLSQISLDTSKSPPQSLCEDNKKFLAFDEVVKSFFSSKQPASFDLLIEYNKVLFCIEFKNSIPRDIQNNGVKNKAIEGIASLYMLADFYNISLKNYKKYYLVLYKPNTKSPNHTISQNYIRNRIFIKKIEFGLEKYQGTFYDSILTKPCKNFQYLKSKICFQ